MFCCGNCFSDHFLETVIEDKATTTTNCSFCGTKDVAVVEPEELADTFQPVIDMYSEAAGGDSSSIVDLLKIDWCLFENLNNDDSFRLLKEIFPETEFDSKKYTPKANSNIELIERWNSFRDRLKYENRFFYKETLELDHLRNLLDFVILSFADQPKEMYRARCNTEGKIYPKEDMGKPDKMRVGVGRANPVGIPYLYTASTPETAIAEIRPHKSDRVSVAKINVLESLSLADLRNPRRTISPLSLSEDDLNKICSDIGYLCQLGEELSKPVLPREADLEYLPTQYLCEFIKHCGFDGVVYKSSVGDGMNYAIFEDGKYEIREVELYEIMDISIDSEKK